ncbi:hypothetical protein, partial [Lacticaseibacillus paracasei]|uniref:hypothetical protein n=1 Tax=Lacticaseibacillus paracasei TaxID=1597 RepID=UPI0021C27CE5
ASRRKLLSLFVVGTSMIPEFFVLVSFFYHFGWVANLIIKRAKKERRKILHFSKKHENILYILIAQ